MQARWALCLALLATVGLAFVPGEATPCFNEVWQAWQALTPEQQAATYNPMNADLSAPVQYRPGTKATPIVAGDALHSRQTSPGPRSFLVDEFNWYNPYGNEHSNGHNELMPLSDMTYGFRVSAGASTWGPWFAQPVDADGMICVPEAGYLYVHQISDGSLVWSANVGINPFYGYYYCMASPCIFEMGGQSYVAMPVYSGGQYLRCFKLSDGSVQWTTSLGGGGYSGFLRPVYYDGYIYVTNGAGSSTPVYKVEVTSGAASVFCTMGGYSWGTPAIDGDNGWLFMCDQGADVIRKYDLASGTQLATASFYGAGQCSYANGYVVGASYYYGGIMCFDAATMSQVWAASCYEDVQTPAIDEENVYVGTQQGTILAFDLETGTQQWSWYSGASGDASDGIAAVTSTVGMGSRRVYAVIGYSTGANLVVFDATDGTLLQRWQQTSYQAFTGMSRGTGVATMRVAYGGWDIFTCSDLTLREHDIKLQAVLAPSTAKLEPGVTFAPTVQYANLGAVAETDVPIVLEIDSAGTVIFDTAFLYSFAVDETATFVFENWTPSAEPWVGYTLSTYSDLAGDQNPGNNGTILGLMTSLDLIYSQGLVPAAAPTIDGYIMPGEWDDAYLVDGSNICNMPGGSGNGQPAGSAYAYFGHTAEYLYMCFVMPNDVLRNINDQIGTYFDEDNDGAWSGGNMEGNYWFLINGSLEDEAQFRPIAPDGTPGTPINAVGSSTASGVLNDYLVFETRVPFGVMPWQLSFGEGDTCGLWFYELGNKWYGWWRPALWSDSVFKPYHYGKLVLRGAPQTGDVGVRRIVKPGANEQPNTAFTPEATIQNYGASGMNYTAWMFLNNTAGTRVYSEYVTGTLGAGASENKTFPAFNPLNDTGDWVAKCSLVVSGDINPANDWLVKDFTVSSAPAWPYGWVEVASMTSGAKAVKDGGWLVWDEETQRIYAARGNKVGEFYAYEPQSNTWSPRAQIPGGIEAKMPYKGATGVLAGNALYATKGNNTRGFWKYDLGDSVAAWVQVADVPLLPDGKKVKGGTDMVYVVDQNDSAWVYLLKGYKQSFFRYNTRLGTWDSTSLPSAPIGMKPKWDKGSWLVYDGDNTIWAHKAKFQELWKFDVAAGTWSTTALSGMPLVGRTGKTKKSKDGGSAAFYEGAIYALKGGNTVEWWKCSISDTGVVWTELASMPEIGSTAKKKRVKAGGDVTSWGDGYFFALKGNKTNEVWRYGEAPVFGPRPGRSGVMAEVAAGAMTFALAPNPLSGGWATLSYSLPQAGPVRMTVFDVTGRSVLSQAFAAARRGTARLDLRNLSAGVYLVKLQGQGVTAARKLIVQ